MATKETENLADKEPPRKSDEELLAEKAKRDEEERERRRERNAFIYKKWLEAKQRAEDRAKVLAGDPFAGILLQEHPEWNRTKHFDLEIQKILGVYNYGGNFTKSEEGDGEIPRIFKWGNTFYMDKYYEDTKVDKQRMKNEIKTLADYLGTSTKNITTANDLVEYNRKHDFNYNEVLDKEPKPLTSKEIGQGQEITDEQAQAMRIEKIKQDWGSLEEYNKQLEKKELRKQIREVIKGARTKWLNGEPLKEFTPTEKKLIIKWGTKDANGNRIWTGSEQKRKPQMIAISGFTSKLNKNENPDEYVEKGREIVKSHTPDEETRYTELYAEAYSTIAAAKREKQGDTRTPEQYIKDYTKSMRERDKQYAEKQKEADKNREVIPMTKEEYDEAQKKIREGIAKITATKEGLKSHNERTTKETTKKEDKEVVSLRRK